MMEKSLNGTEKQTGAPLRNFEHAGFASLFKQFQPVSRLDGGPITPGHSFYRGVVNYRGEEFDASVKRHISYIEDTDIVRSESFEIKIFDSGASVTLVVFLAYSGEVGIASTNIIKEDVDKRLPKGIGVHLYKFLFSLFDDIARQKGISLVHEVSKGSVKNQTLSDERWKQIFEPVLRAAGYKEVQNPNDPELIGWSKSYEPI